MNKQLLKLEAIGNITGAGSKVIIQEELRELLQDEKMKYIFTIVHHPFIDLPVKKFDIKTFGSGDFDFYKFKDIVEKLSYAKARNNELVELVVNFITDLKPELQSIVSKIFRQSLKLGFSTKTVNKVMKKDFKIKSFIPEPSSMLASKGIKHTEKFGSEVIINCKMDGSRLLITKQKGNYKIYSRNFKVIENRFFNNILKQVNNLTEGMDNFFLDGELISKYANGAERLKISGDFTRCIRGTAEENIDEKFMYTIFDINPLDVLEEGESEILTEREKKLEQLFLNKTYTNIEKINSYIVKNDKDIINNEYQKFIDAGHEGIIVKNMNGVYVPKRSRDWIKIKAELDADLEILEIKSGSGKYSNTCGKIYCKSSDGKVTVSIGSGLSDEQRDELWNNKEKYIGSIVECNYNEKIQDKHGNYSLFLPIFKFFRLDKDVANSFDEIK